MAKALCGKRNKIENHSDRRLEAILSEYERLLSPKTKLISITQASNVLGTSHR
ncbi:aminotransferase, class V domain protein [Leptospira borgpetersenii serovar Hardjo-bovis str. Sponselee]|uniref:Aminotransferase, class V domain protein n=1 Tax=Leptospira borgpetersenii serovar Hardjo-bovis str. Sponselee TaxID=1303729 RepID=M6BP88_LEPBO|nr:aminotransferase, class V domain protein [Leptospira borgpetersenii serovar Hardjo-bovis str. Sponselee]